MSKQHTLRRGLSRRAFLRAGAGGLCGLCLAAVTGCGQAQGAPEAGQVQAGQVGFVMPSPSPWFSALAGDRVRCELCPKACELGPGQRSPCRVRENRGGVGYTMVFGNPALVQEDPVERKPFFHVLPGSRALSIATAGCNLACKFCEVWDMAQVAPEQIHAYHMPPEAILAQAQMTQVRSISYSFGEPVAFFEYMMAVADLARQAGLLNLMHTAGYIQPRPLKELSARLDAVNIDLKGFDPAFYREVVGGELDTVLRTLVLLREQGVHIEVTNIIIPALNDDMGKVAEMCRWIANELGPDVPLHLARFYPLHKLADLPRTPIATLDQARQTALDAGLRFVYVAGVTGHEAESSFCPDCGETIIKRIGFVIAETRLENGNCGFCGSVIPGRWA